MTVTLADAMELKRDIKSLTEKLEEIRRSNKMEELERQLKQLQSQYAAILGMLNDLGTTSEGTLRIINRGRTYRSIDPEKLKSIDKDIYELVSDRTTISIKDFNELTRDYPSESIDKLLDEICISVSYPKYEVIDALEGE